MSKIDVMPIVKRHLETLINHRTERRSKTDMILFFGAPFIVAGVAAYFRVSLTADILTGILASFSIFAGLLLNLLLLVYARAGEEVKADIFATTIKDFVRQLSANIEYAVLVSVFVVIFSLIAMITLNGQSSVVVYSRLAVSAILIFLTANFLLTLLMVLKRMHAMLVEKLDRPSATPMKKAS